MPFNAAAAKLHCELWEENCGPRFRRLFISRRSIPEISLNIGFFRKRARIHPAA
jgi:hypothetical protein